MNIEFCKCSGIGTKNWEKGEHFIISAFIPTDFIAQNYSEKELKYINNEPLTKFWGNKILTKDKRNTAYINCRNCFKSPENCRYDIKITNSENIANKFKKKILHDIHKVKRR